MIDNNSPEYRQHQDRADQPKQAGEIKAPDKGGFEKCDDFVPDRDHVTPEPLKTPSPFSGEGYLKGSGLSAAAGRDRPALVDKADDAERFLTVQDHGGAAADAGRVHVQLHVAVLVRVDGAVPEI